MRWSVLLAVWLSLVVMSPWTAAQDVAAPPSWNVDGTRAKEFVAHLSTDAMAGRASGTDGFRQAAEWAAGLFQEWGLKPAGENGTYFQPVKLHDFDFQTGVPSLRVGSREFPIDDNDFSVEGRSSSNGVTVAGEVVFAGYGIAAAEQGLDEYAGLDVQGKVVLVLRGSPHTAPALRSPFEGDGSAGQTSGDDSADPWAEHAQDATKIRVAYERGAAGVLLFDPDEAPEDGRRRRSRSAASGEPFIPQRDFLCFTIKERVFRALVRTDPQETARGLKRRFDALRREIQTKQARSFATHVTVVMKGYDQSVRIAEQLGNNVANNVLALIEGSDPVLKDQYVVIGAHLDHIGSTGAFVYNGADDNASGSAVVLEVARTLAQGNFAPRRTLVFALWTGEELGLLGSLHYTKQPTAGVTMDKIVGSFNMDMVGMGEKLDASGALNFPTIWEVMQRDQCPEILSIIEPRTGGPGGSDHTGFIRKGIQTVFLMSRGGIGHPDYHQPEDDTAKIEPEMLRRTGQFVLQAVMNLANETEVNLLIDRRQDLYDALRLRIANLNPEVEGSAWSVVDLPAENRDALLGQVVQEVQQLVKSQPSGGGRAEGAQARPGKSIVRGLTRMELIGTDLRLLDLVVELYGIGRVDIPADHPFWVVNGRLSDDGRTMLAALQERKVAVHLRSPSTDLLSDVLNATSQPFVVTGEYQIPEDLLERSHARGILWGVNLNPAAVDDFLTRVEELKARLGERKNLFAYLVSAEGLDAAKTPLYLGLLDRGWGRTEIFNSQDHRGLLGGAALDALTQ